MATDKQFTFFWFDGTRNVLTGPDAAQALNDAGYASKATRGLDFYSDSDDQSWEWDSDRRQWIKKQLT